MLIVSEIFSSTTFEKCSHFADLLFTRIRGLCETHSVDVGDAVTKLCIDHFHLSWRNIV